MKLTVEQFRAWQHKSITLLGMSGVGKTRLSCILRRADWFHYSGDYRIGTRYLGEPILDNIKLQAMQVPFLRDLLRSDSISISNNITIDHLKPVSSYLGKLGNPELGGLSLSEYKHRQRQHLEAEIAAMKDVPDFIEKAQSIYGYENFINDAGGSVCELDDPSVLEVLDRHTLIVYIKATEADEKVLIERARSAPKPLFYREAFLDELLETYMAEKALTFPSQIEPDDFVRWSFPRLFYSRIPRYEAIADRYGYTVTTDEIARVEHADDFVELLAEAIGRAPCR